MQFLADEVPEPDLLLVLDVLHHEIVLRLRRLRFLEELVGGKLAAELGLGVGPTFLFGCQEGRGEERSGKERSGVESGVWRGRAGQGRAAETKECKVDEGSARRASP